MALYVKDLEKLRGQPLSVILADPEDWAKDTYGERRDYGDMPGGADGLVCEVCLSGALLLRHGLQPWLVRELGDIVAMKETHHDQVDSYLGEKVILDRIVRQYAAETGEGVMLENEQAVAEEFNDAASTFHDEVLEVCRRFDKEVGCAVS